MALITTVTKENKPTKTPLVRLSVMQLIMCLPCAVMMGMSDVAKAAAAHRLILCENSVKYEVGTVVSVCSKLKLYREVYSEDQ